MNKKKKSKKSDLNKLLAYLNQKFNLKPRNKSLYTKALTHESHCYENNIDINESYEKLEFLGDSVLGLIINKHLCNHYTELRVGDLSKCKSRVVSAAVLLDLAQKIKLGNYLILGRGEESSGGRRRDSILADSFEALLGALYLDLGFAPVEKMVISLYGSIINKSMTGSFDHKSILQEKIQEKYRSLPHYRTLREKGPAHQKTFEIAVYHNGELLGKGEGHSKKEAEQQAAMQALEEISRRDTQDTELLDTAENTEE